MAHHKGIHHITVLAGDAQRNADFYTELLGMRLVKKSVNQDDPGTYHLFYGNQSAEPGSSLTFFPWPNAVKGKPGVGEVVNVGLQVPEASEEYWQVRLSEYDVNYEVVEVFGKKALRFEDPDGLELDLVFEGGAKEKVENVDYIVPAEYTVQGFWGAKMLLAEKDHTQKLIQELFGFEKVAEEGSQTLYQTDATIGRNVIIEVAEQHEHGTNGRGIVHHIAYRAENKEELGELRQKVGSKGLQPTQIIDRHWFNSVYYRIPAGVLFEMASDDPGYTVDEEFEHLGEQLILPPWLENKRDRIEEVLPALKIKAGAAS
ncbi:VOC family protein [Gracilimonas mengyeensis]|uniref:Glyoxalase family protein n=1 Tax=Gracilimonas mengyeensis TaxID=1302730 RepID=A0A521DMX3_9BACT|nr:VOC family protein [Gracilimonas mengyeensis]SMO72411.1 glyoxalase family protein [Gracilimonas mengyeensis]